MSDNFDSNNYSEYFKYLESKLADSGRNDSAPVSDNKNDISQTENERRKSSRRYKVIKIKPLFLIVCFAAVIAVICGTVSFAASKNKTDKHQKSDNSVFGISYPEDSTENAAPPISYRFSDSTLDIPTSNDANGAIIVNTATHEVVAARSANERFYPASTTKIMTLLVAAENITNFNDTFTMTLDITDPLFEAEASVAGFLSGEAVSMTDLLYGTILPSGADAAVGLAVKIAGSEAAFAKLMNKKAKELGLENTHFVNVTGLFDENHYSSPYDMAIILETALKYPLCKKILSTYQYTTRSTPQHPDGIPLSATLFDYMYGTEPETATVLGGKTGFVNESGYCIATYGSNNTTGNEYIVVTFKNSSRWPAIHGQIDLYKQFAE